MTPLIFLALDVGEKRIGAAKSDELGFMAHPLDFIERQNDQWVVEKVKALIEEHRIGAIVVGLPKTLKGEIGTKAKEMLTFVEMLKTHLNCPIETWDERYTTAEAERRLLSHDVSRAKRRIKRDSIAAEIMLQSYLDYHRNQ